MNRSPEPRRPDRPAVRRGRELRRTGHRREHASRDGAPRRRDRRMGALADIGAHRAVAYQDVVDVHFDGHPYAARREIDKLKREGLVTEHRADGPNGGSFTVLAATPKGAREAPAAARGRGYAEDQHFWSGLGRREDLAHDVAVYRAVLAAREELAAKGITAVRVRLDAELRRAVVRRSEKARARAGREAADAERRRAAAELGLPHTPEGAVSFPDAQLEYAADEAGGRDTFGRVNIEVTTEHYRAGAVAAKAAAGFALHAANGGANGKAGRMIAKVAKAFREAARPQRSGGARDPRPPELMEI